jgi:hypothetical protein
VKPLIQVTPMNGKFRYQPGWSTTVPIDYSKPSLIAWFLGIGKKSDCLTRSQGKCPGLDHCHDCPWSRQRDST